jgi:uncharacterized coiled-coil protein SlyX
VKHLQIHLAQQTAEAQEAEQHSAQRISKLTEQLTSALVTKSISSTQANGVVSPSRDTSATTKSVDTEWLSFELDASSHRCAELQATVHSLRAQCTQQQSQLAELNHTLLHLRLKFKHNSNSSIATRV